MYEPISLLSCSGYFSVTACADTLFRNKLMYPEIIAAGLVVTITEDQHHQELYQCSALGL